MQQYLGTQIAISDDMVGEIKNYKIDCVQFFFRLPKKRVNKDMMSQVSTYCKKNGIRMYVHGSYSINLSMEVEGKTNWMIDSIVKDMKYANSIGVTGLVVHTGKYLERDPKDALADMYKSIQAITAEIADLDITLLLETSAGQGTELLYNFDDFLSFYNSFTPNMKRKTFICIDTCHLFVSGFEIKSADQLFKHVNDKVGEVVKLIHLNDSAREFGTRVDRHASIGTGTIGQSILIDVYRYAKKHKIDTVIETSSKVRLRDIDLVLRLAPETEY